MTEKGFEVSASEIRGRWPWMNEMERMDFASNFHLKETWTENDSEVLGILMNDGDDNIWGTCALAMLRHPDQNRAVEFLIERVKRNESDRPPLNYIQALGIAGDRRAVPVIRPYYEKCLKAMELKAATGVPDDIFWGPVPYHAFLSIAGALLKDE
jgi:hypothetical protein